MKISKTENFEKGLGMVEIIIVTAVIVVAFVAILQLLQLESRTERTRREELRAYALIAEGLEAVRTMRDADWSSISGLTMGADYYAQINAGAWELITVDPGPIDGFTRWVVIDSVRRNTATDDIDPSGVIDADTVRVSAYAEWESAGDTKTRSVSAYLTNWQNKL